jgi:hypothetical protein
MSWTVRSAIAMVLWALAGLLTLLFIFSGSWLIFPFAFAGGGGGQVFTLLLAIGGLALAAHLIGRRASS